MVDGTTLSEVEASGEVTEVEDVILSELENWLELTVDELDIIAEELDKVTGAADPMLSEVEAELALARELELEMLEAGTDVLLAASDEEAPIEEVELLVAFPATLLLAVERTEDAVVGSIALELVDGPATEVVFKARLELELEAVACVYAVELELKRVSWLEEFEATATEDELLVFPAGIEELVLELDELPAVIADEEAVIWLDELIVTDEEVNGLALLLLVEAATRDEELLDELVSIDDELLGELAAIDDELLDELAPLDDELLDEVTAVDDELLEELAAIDDELLDELAPLDDELLDELAAIDGELTDSAETDDDLLVERASVEELVDRLEELVTPATDDVVLTIELEELLDDAWFDFVMVLELGELEELGIAELGDPVLEEELA